MDYMRNAYPPGTAQMELGFRHYVWNPRLLRRTLIDSVFWIDLERTSPWGWTHPTNLLCKANGLSSDYPHHPWM